MADATDPTKPTEGADAGSASETPDFYKLEAKKAFEARDAAKRELKRLQDAGRVLTDDQVARFQELETQASKAEDERKRKEGEFDSWRATIAKKHETELTAAQKIAEAAKAELHQTLIGLSFAGAADYFGGDTAKTILTPEIAEAFYGRYVEVHEHDGRKAVVVKDPTGQIILDAKSGQPASFAVAIGELIEALPNRDKVLRGSGKTGSGSSGGSVTSAGGPVDLSRLKADSFSDPKVRSAVKAQQAKAGGLQIGPAWDRGR